jgi:hypothetical protein
METVDIPESHRTLFRVVFGSIIRNCSNADPVPVSGLEVTAHMKRRDLAGRLVDPYTMLETALHRAVRACEDYGSMLPAGVSSTVMWGDATQLQNHLTGHVDAVITSPPYHGAVDYYRRHQLEMFWLGLVRHDEDRRALLHRYVGRTDVPRSHEFVHDTTLRTAIAKRWEAKIRRSSEDRADAFKHYIVAMRHCFEGLADHMRAGSPAVLVVGHSSWNNSKIPTTELFGEIAGSAFTLREVLWYPIKNRYMSYSRHNGADINREYVLAFYRTNRLPRRRDN